MATSAALATPSGRVPAHVAVHSVPVRLVGRGEGGFFLAQDLDDVRPGVAADAPVQRVAWLPRSFGPVKSLIAALLICFAFVAHGQAAKPMLKANTVVIQTPDSAAVALRKLAQAFVAQGYTVDKLDTQFLTLLLAPKILAVKYSPAFTVRASATAGSKSTLRLTGEYKATAGDVPLMNIAQYEGTEWGLNSRCFRAMEKVALTYPAGQIGYAKQ